LHINYSVCILLTEGNDNNKYIMITERLKQARDKKVQDIHDAIRESNASLDEAAEFFGFDNKNSFKTMLYGRSFGYDTADRMHKMIPAFNERYGYEF